MRNRAFVGGSVCLFALVAFAGSVFASVDVGTVKGTVKAVATAAGSSQSSLVPDAILTLTNRATPDKPVSTTTDGAGAFIFENLPSGTYTLTIDAPGMARVTREITVESGALLAIDIDLNATVNESVTVRGEEGLLSSSDVSTSNIVRGETLKEQPLRTDNFQNALPLTPGVVRDGRGNDYVKGTRTGQNGYTVNGADVTDPATGNLVFDIPLEAASSVQIEDNPYAASFGRFTGGVTNLQTKGGGEKFKITAARFMPALHNIFSTKVDSFRPRVTFSGPIVKGKLYFLQSLEYRYSRYYITSQRSPNNATIQQSVNSFSQIDWNVNSKNVVKLTAAFFPGSYRNSGMDTFNPASATPDLKQNGALVTVSEQAIFSQSSFLSSQVSYKSFRSRITPKSNLPFTVSPQGVSGGYFSDTNRWSGRIESQETYYAPKFNLLGGHSLTAGTEIYHTRVGGQINYRPIYVRRFDGTPSEKINFTRATSLGYGYTDAAGFVQDRWVIDPKFTLDVGIRFDRDGIVETNNTSPRASVLIKPFAGGKTTVRAGVGIFYDRSLSSEGYFNEAPDDPLDPNQVFKHLPRRVITTYAADGATIVDGPRLYRMRLSKELATPRSLRWSAQVDQAITRELTLRLGYTRRETTHDLIIDQVVGTGNISSYMLSSRGRSQYSEFQAVATYNGDRLGHWTGFYTYSRSRGDLNTGDLFLADQPAYSIKSNAAGPLPFDAPHRFMFYGEIDVSKKLGVRLSPLVEMHTGFPFSAVNERLDFVGLRNSMRYPTYFSIDLQGTKSVKLPFLKDKRARIGLAVLNITNHFNPRDAQTNITSPSFGKFYNSLGPSIKMKFDMDL